MKCRHKKSRNLKLVNLVCLGATFALGACSFAPSGKVTLRFEISKSGALVGGDIGSQASHGMDPANVVDFDYMAINVMGANIVPSSYQYGGTWDYHDFVTNISTRKDCAYVGATSTLVSPSVGGIIELEVTPGQEHVIQVIGIKLGDNPGEDDLATVMDNYNPFTKVLGQVVADVLTDTSVTVPDTYVPDTYGPAFCGGPIGGGGDIFSLGNIVMFLDPRAMSDPLTGNIADGTALNTIFHYGSGSTAFGALGGSNPLMDYFGINGNPALNFNGGGTSRYLGADAAVHMTGGFTIGAAVYLVSDTIQQTIVAKGDFMAPDNQFRLDWGGTTQGYKFEFYVSNGSTEDVIQSTQSLVAGNHLIVAVYDDASDTFSIRVNGIEASGTTLKSIPLTSQPLVVGAHVYASPQYDWMGQIGSLIIYDSPLDPSGRVKVECFMANDYNLEGILPGGHCDGI